MSEEIIGQARFEYSEPQHHISPSVWKRLCLLTFMLSHTSLFFSLRELQELLLPLCILQVTSAFTEFHSTVYKKWYKTDSFNYKFPKALAVNLSWLLHQIDKSSWFSNHLQGHQAQLTFC